MLFTEAKGCTVLDFKGVEICHNIVNPTQGFLKENRTEELFYLSRSFLALPFCGPKDVSTKWQGKKDLGGAGACGTGSIMINSALSSSAIVTR